MPKRWRVLSLALCGMWGRFNQNSWEIFGPIKPNPLLRDGIDPSARIVRLDREFPRKRRSISTHSRREEGGHSLPRHPWQRVRFVLCTNIVDQNDPFTLDEQIHLVGLAARVLTATEIIAMEGDVEAPKGMWGTPCPLEDAQQWIPPTACSRLQTNDHRIVPWKMNFVQLATKSVQR